MLLAIEQNPEQPLSEADQDLIQDIKQAFWDTVYPGDEHIRCNAIILSEYERLTDYFGKTWQEVSLETVVKYRNETYFFTIEGWSYYLPVWMIAILCHPSAADTLSDSIWSRLTPRSKSEIATLVDSIRPLLPPQNDPISNLDRARPLAKRLNLSQILVVCRFLERERRQFFSRIRSQRWKTIQWWKDQGGQKQVEWDLDHPNEFIPPKHDPLLARDDLVWKKNHLSPEDRMMMLAPFELFLLTAIEQAFADTLLSPPEEMFKAASYPKAEQARQHWQGKRWQEVSVCLIAEHSAIVNALSPVGMAYYLPAWLKASIQDWDVTEGLHDLLEYRFSPGENLSEDNASFAQIVSLLTLAQKRILLWYFRYYQAQAEEPEHRAWVIQIWEQEVAKEEAHLASVKTTLS